MIIAFFKNAEISLLRFQAGIIESAIRPYDRHEERMAPEGCKAANSLQILRNSQDAVAGILMRDDFLYEIRIFYIRAQIGMHGLANNLG
jgi:hypothetical protein